MKERTNERTNERLLLERLNEFAFALSDRYITLVVLLATTRMVCYTERMWAWQIQRPDGLWYWAEYSTFSVSDEVDQYRLTVDGYSGDAGDAMAGTPHETWRSNGKQFSTPDRDNAGQNYVCSANHGFGWWWDLCSVSAISGNGDSTWSASGENMHDIQTARMMVRVN